MDNNIIMGETIPIIIGVLCLYYLYRELHKED